MTTTAYRQLPIAKRNAMNKARLKNAMTPAEGQFLAWLTSLAVPHRYQQGFYYPYHRIADFYLPEQKLIVQIDGQCHDAEKDQRRDRWFESVRGIKDMRLTNEQMFSGSFEATVRDFVR